MYVWSIRAYNCLNVYAVPTGEMVIMTELDLENHDGTPSKHSGVF